MNLKKIGKCGLLVVMAMVGLSLVQCKARRNSQTKDLVHLDDDGIVYLTYVDGEVGQEKLHYARCGKLKGDIKFEQLLSENLRDQCSPVIDPVAYQDFRTKWQSLFRQQAGVGQLTLLDRQTFEDIEQGLYLDPKQQSKAQSFKINYASPASRSANAQWIKAFENLIALEIKNPQTQQSNQAQQSRRAQNVNESSPSTAVTSYSKKLSDDREGGSSYSLVVRNFKVGVERKIETELSASQSEQICPLKISYVSWTAADGSSAEVHALANEGAAAVYQISGADAGFGQLKFAFVNDGRGKFDCQFKVALSSSADVEKNRTRIPVAAGNDQERDQVMRKFMGAVHHRYSHYMWHAARNAYFLPGVRRADQANIEYLGWKPPRPVLYDPNTGKIDFGRTAASGAGEDFLYMHRVMVRDLAAHLQSKGLTMYEPWSKIPDPSDNRFPILVQESREQSVAGYQSILTQSLEYSRPKIGKFNTLSELGTYLEFTVHNALHTRWSAASRQARPQTEDPVQMMLQRSLESFRWNIERYDHLADPYAAHVNPIFWRLHGWVDQRIDEWLAEKNLTLEADCTGKTRCISWKSDVWSGPSHDQIFSTVGSQKVDQKSMAETLRLLGQNAFMATNVDSR
jgi:hypothetical protein